MLMTLAIKIIGYLTYILHHRKQIVNVIDTPEKNLTAYIYLLWIAKNDNLYIGI